MAITVLGATPLEQAALVREGLPYDLFDELARDLDLSSSELASVIRVPLRTLQRRKAEGTFPVEESDRLLRVALLATRARDVLGDDAARWLKSPKQFLGGETPLGFSDTEVGAGEVTQALGRLEHGVFL